MAFDQPTRNRLAKFVAEARGLLTAEFTRQMQQVHGMDPDTGQVTEMERLNHLNDADRETARLLRETMDHYLAVTPRSAKAVQDVLDRIVREQAFTVLNRLCALRMAEARALLIESIAKGAQSKGFQPYARLAGTALGQTGDAYQCYLFSLFDEFALDLPVLFDRFSPQGRLFPRESALNNLLDLINAPELEQLWAEDETIGWIYQYFNPKVLKDTIKKDSKVPRNSYEIAIRSSYYTPRFVVAFITDNTLGRIWYEMTREETALISECRYLVRRPREVFLEQPGRFFSDVQHPGIEAALGGDFSQLPEPDAITWNEIQKLALGIDGYKVAPALGLGDCLEFAGQRISESRQSGQWRGDAAELWICLFYEQRASRYAMELPSGEHLAAITSLYAALRQQLTMDTSELSQQELLNLPVFIPHRPRKDPRDLLMLDPACGSMHFGLYAFDLYERIYEEAWHHDDAPPSQATGRPLREDYPELDHLLRDLPKLIIEHNIHGIDIDPRAVQIAGLSLWLRAQKSWKARNIQPQARPRITKSHIVCAEPMPGDETLRQEFVESLRPRVLGQLVNEVFEKMKLAGEAGSLLKIEEEIKDAVEAAKQQAKEPTKQEKGMLPGIKLPEKPKQLRFDLSDVSDKDFWRDTEQRILDALKKYAEQTENGNTVRRRLFAEDAARGFAFIDLCRKQYDVVLMNPPYAETEEHLQAFLKRCYPGNWTNLYSAFIERGQAFCKMRIGLVCPDGFLSAYRMRKIRREIIEKKNLEELSCLGKDVFDEMGLSTIGIVLNRKYSGLQPLLVNLTHEGIGILDIINGSVVNERTKYILTPDLIRGGSLRWEEAPLSPTYGLVTKGNCTFDDFRFIRLWWEAPVKNIGSRWQMWQKGGEYQPFFSSTPYVIDWEKENDGAAIRCYGYMNVGTDAQVAQSSRYWWQDGLVGPALNTTGAGFNIRILPKNQIFSAKSTVIFPKSRVQAWLLLALLNSRMLRWLLYQQGAGLSGNTGKIKNLPIVWPNGDVEKSLMALSQEATMLMADLEAFRDTSLCFKGVIRPYHETIDSYRECAKRLDETVASLYCQEVQDEVVKRTIDLAESALVEATDGHITKPLGHSLQAYFVGILFARWDIRLALDSTLAPPLPDPFDPLPICPPGMLIGPDSLPATPGNIVSEEWLRKRAEGGMLYTDGKWIMPEDAELSSTAYSLLPTAYSSSRILPTDTDYPIRIPWNGIIVDDENHPDDIIRRVREVLDVIWKDKAGDIEQEACQILGVAGLREYFRKPSGFFADHLKRYSKSRRQAPIYWPLSSASGDYTLWIYYHRLTDQTLYTCVNDFVEPRLKQIAERLEALRGMERRGAAEKEYEEQGRLEQELREFRDELLRIAAFWKPNLNDGVQITASPLWRLFRLKPWQKKLKETWDKLKAGDYDWAHLAYSIWPDRVRDVCKTDRSIAIAHGLEELCEVEVAKKGKKRGRKK